MLKGSRSSKNTHNFRLIFRFAGLTSFFDMLHNGCKHVAVTFFFSSGLVQHDTPIEHTEAQHVFKKVWKKHHYQREKKQFVTPDHPSKEMPVKEDLKSWQTDGTSEAKMGDNSELKTIQTDSHIDRVEMAMDVVRGFSDWGADCPNSDKPGINLDSNGVRVNWGRQKCRVSLMGQRITIFDFNFGNTNVNWPEPIKTVTRSNYFQPFFVLEL